MKAIAHYLEFEWRDKTPSGALSIEWYNQYLETGDRPILERILLYNEDDCGATERVQDSLVRMSIEQFPESNTITTC